MFVKIRRIQKSRENVRVSVAINGTLLLIVLTHMVLSIPYNVVGIILSAPAIDFFERHVYKNLHAVFPVTYIMKLFSHAINHFLYCFTNEEIRNETMHTFACLKGVLCKRSKIQPK